VPAGMTTWQLWQLPAYRSRIRLVVGLMGTDTTPPGIDNVGKPRFAAALTQPSAVHGFD
jgi:hypothetical protein